MPPARKRWGLKKKGSRLNRLIGYSIRNQVQVHSARPRNSIPGVPPSTSKATGLQRPARTLSRPNWNLTWGTWCEKFFFSIKLTALYEHCCIGKAEATTGLHTYPPEFDRFWSSYPNRPTNTKAGAFKAWDKTVTSGVDPPHLQAGADRYGDFCRRTGREIMLVQTKMNREGWTDSYKEATAMATEIRKSSEKGRRQGSTSGRGGGSLRPLMALLG